MFDSRIAELESRIQRLESARGRWRGVAGVAVMTLVALLGFGAMRQPEIQDEIRARKVVVVDEKDVPRVVIAQDPADTQRRSRSAGITIHDATGAERFGVGVMDDNTVNMGFDAAVGVGLPMRDRLALGVSPNGSPYVMLINNETKVPVRLVADGDPKKGGGIEFLDYDRANSKVIIRRISFNSDEKTEVPHKFSGR
jgi:hypothetical protein